VIAVALSIAALTVALVFVAIHLKSIASTMAYILFEIRNLRKRDVDP
jgi:hypothetical protein